MSLNLAEAQNTLLNCWVESYQASFDFKKELDNLEAQLLELKMLKDTTKKSYERLLKKSESSKAELEKVIVNQYVSLKPFLNCINDIAPYQKTDTEYKYMMLFSIYHAYGTKSVSIDIKVFENQVIKVNDEEISRENLALKLKEVINSNPVVPTDEWIASMTVESEVKMGLIIQVQQILKEVGMKKVVYNSKE